MRSITTLIMVPCKMQLSDAHYETVGKQQLEYINELLETLTACKRIENYTSVG
jgi:hypothetical protein